MPLNPQPLFEALFQHANTCQVVCNISGEILRCNHAFTEKFEWQEKDIEGKNLNFIIPSADWGITESFVATLKQEKEKSSFQQILIKKNSEIVNSLISAVPVFENNEITAFIATIEDIAGLNEILYNEKLFRSLYEESPIPIILEFTPNQKISRANAKFCQLIGYSIEELHGRISGCPP